MREVVQECFFRNRFDHFLYSSILLTRNRLHRLIPLPGIMPWHAGLTWSLSSRIIHTMIGVLLVLLVLVGNAAFTGALISGVIAFRTKMTRPKLIAAGLSLYWVAWFLGSWLIYIKTTSGALFHFSGSIAFAAASFSAILAFRLRHPAFVLIAIGLTIFSIKYVIIMFGWHAYGLKIAIITAHIAFVAGLALLACTRTSKCDSGSEGRENGRQQSLS